MSNNFNTIEGTEVFNVNDPVQGSHAITLNDVKAFVSNGSSGLEEITYDVLISSINSNSLSQGKTYLLTDYRTIHYMQDGDIPIFTAVNQGPIEPLIITASSPNTIEPVAYSTLHPEDVLHYDWNPSNHLTDMCLTDINNHGDINLSVIINGFKGVISYREDTKYKNICHFDFRYARFRRWAVNVPEYSLVNNYNEGDIVRFENVLYKSKVNSNIGNEVIFDFSLNSLYWSTFLDLSETSYWNTNSVNDNQIPSDSEDFIDVGTFAYLYEQGAYYNNFIGPCSTNNRGFLASVFSNLVFISNSNASAHTIYNVIAGNALRNYNTTIGQTFYGNKIGTDFSNNLISNNFYNNDIANNFGINLINNDFYANTIGDSFYNNIISNGFYHNDIDNNFNGNIIGEFFINNKIGNDFSNNSIGAIFEKNSIGISFNGNIIGDRYQNITVGTNFNSNTIGNDFTNSSIGNNFNSNTIADNFSNNTIGNNFNSNTISNDFYNFKIITGQVNGVNFDDVNIYNTIYTKEIFRKPDGSFGIMWVNFANELIISDLLASTN